MLPGDPGSAHLGDSRDKSPLRHFPKMRSRGLFDLILKEALQIQKKNSRVSTHYTINNVYNFYTFSSRCMQLGKVTESLLL